MPGIIGDIDGAYYDTSIRPAPGLLTGGEWRDNDHWSDWCFSKWKIKNNVIVDVISIKVNTNIDGNIPIMGTY